LKIFKQFEIKLSILSFMPVSVYKGMSKYEVFQ